MAANLHPMIYRNPAPLWALLALALLSFTGHDDFLAGQRKYERVRTAIREKGGALDSLLAKAGLDKENLNVLLVAYKDHDRLEVHAKKNIDERYVKLRNYPVCARSGRLGPKRRQGDLQVPEGFYHIDRFNPVSNYYLSLGINYPNASDRRKSQARNLGGDIFIHGSCATIGCLPMTDEGIKEIYLLCAYARNAGQTALPVYIFPFEMTDANMERYRQRFAGEKGLVAFWENLKAGHDRFLATRRQLEVRVLADGDYAF